MKDFEIRCDESRLETTNLIYGKFTLGPFLPGQATTFGNALRRSLLAELSGLAITAFEIIGVMQEFSTLPGLRESILDLSLNLKQIVLTGVLPHSTPPIGFLNVRGPAIIKASDLKLPAGVYCASPNQYIATLSSNGMLHLKFVVSVGKGYSIQPYSIYRSLSKIRLQPASNFDNTCESGQLRTASPLTKYQQLEENSKRVDSLGQNIVNPYANSVNKETPSHTARPALDPARAINPPAYFDKYNKDSSTTSKGELRTDTALHDKAKEPRYNMEPSSQLLTPKDCFASEGKKASPERLAEQVRGSSYARQAPEELAKLGASGREITNSQTLNSLLVNNDQKNLNYINIQTQLFQRITPHQVLPIDAVFTPVSQVNFLTEVNDRFETARENIVLEIWTNGSIHPKRALEEATLSLVQNFDTLLKKIQQASSFYKGFRYWNYLHSFKSSLGEKANDLSYVPSSPASGYTQRVKEQIEDELAVGAPAQRGSTATNSYGLLRTKGKPLFVPKGGKQLLTPTDCFASEGKKASPLPTSSISEVANCLRDIGSYARQDKQSIKGLAEKVNNKGAFTSSMSEAANFPEGVAELAEGFAPAASGAKQIEDVKALREIKLATCKTSEAADSQALRARTKETLQPPIAQHYGKEGTSKNCFEQETEFNEESEALLRTELIEKLLKKDLPQSIYNLDIGNLNFSLQTFIFLKKAKIHTLLQLLTQFSVKNKFNSINYVIKENKNNFLNEKIIEELNHVIRQFGSKEFHYY